MTEISGVPAYIPNLGTEIAQCLQRRGSGFWITHHRRLGHLEAKFDAGWIEGVGAEVHPPDFSQHFHADHPVFSCSESEQKQLNTWVSFQSAEQPLLGQFSVSGNRLSSLAACPAPQAVQRR
ncbi:hypothetical protein ACSMFX_03505 [Pseudomonas mosselii]|uniref:hypothetical protein n=1 Tax=Pseudomonas mosselii TaxID=78327 RepID=UPI003F1A9C27